MYRLSLLIGTQVDKISYAREIVSKNAGKIQKARQGRTTKPPKRGNAIFIEYTTQAQARKAYHHLSFNRPLNLDPRYIGISPKEVLWKNLTRSLATRLTMKNTANAFIALTIIFWSIPVGLVGTLSNINYLADKVHFLRFVYDLPPAVLGVLTGLLPPLILSSFISYVPKFMRCTYADDCIR